MLPAWSRSMLGSPKLESFATGRASHTNPFDFERTGAGPAVTVGAVNETVPDYAVAPAAAAAIRRSCPAIGSRSEMVSDVVPGRTDEPFAEATKTWMLP